jgi:hypothetical protein
MKKLIILVFVFSLFLPSLSLADIGIGVGTGKIELNETLKAGAIYNLPPFTILNTGDEASKYSVGTQQRENQEQLRPDKEWFSFEPLEFYLEPGDSQIIQTKLTLPIKGVVPGDYFSFLQGFPIIESKGGATIGVAAATKLYFTVAPANIFVGMYYRLSSLLVNSAPGSYILLAVVIFAILIVFFRQKFSFNVSVGKKK